MHLVVVAADFCHDSDSFTDFQKVLGVWCSMCSVPELGYRVHGCRAASPSTVQPQADMSLRRAMSGRALSVRY